MADNSAWLAFIVKRKGLFFFGLLFVQLFLYYQWTLRSSKDATTTDDKSSPAESSDGTCGPGTIIYPGDETVYPGKNIPDPGKGPLINEKMIAANKPRRCGLSVRPIGRLGNEMFDYLCLLYISRAYTDVKPCLSQTTGEAMSIFKEVFIETDNAAYMYMSSHGKKSNMREVIHNGGQKRFDNDGVMLSKITLPAHVIENFEEDVRRMFTFKDSIVEEVSAYLDHLRKESNISKNKLTFIGVHIRRDDFSKILRGSFLTGEWFSKVMKNVLDYLKLSIKDTIFVVASDDFPWCKSNLDTSTFNIKFTIDNPATVTSDPVAFDLATLTKCNHNIHDYGTFGFWSGMLTKGHVFAPDVRPGEEKVTAPLFISIKNTKYGWDKFRFLDGETGGIRPGCGATW